MKKKAKFTESTLPASVRVSIQYMQPNSVVGMPKGMKRITIATLIDRATNTLLSKGMAICNNKDNDNRKIGRAMAIGRAYKEWWASKKKDNVEQFTAAEVGFSEAMLEQDAAPHH